MACAERWAGRLPGGPVRTTIRIRPAIATNMQPVSAGSGMDSRSDRWRRGTASGTVLAGAFFFSVMGAGTASAGTSAGRGDHDCILRDLLGSVVDEGKAGPPRSPEPPGGSPSGGSPTSGGTPQKARPAARPADASRTHGQARTQRLGPAAQLDASKLWPKSSPKRRPPVLPEIGQSGQQPPRTAPVQAAASRPVAETVPTGAQAPPFLIATASGLGGAVAAFNISALNRRRRSRRS